MKASLDSPRAKLARAHEHLLALNGEVGAFFATEPYEVVAEFDAKAGAHVVRVRIRESPPLRLGAILGDFAQNTRNALDHLVWQLVILNREKPGSKVAFPIWRCASEATPDEIKKRLGKLSGPHRASIEAAQPHHARNAGKNPDAHVLALLAGISNADKHRVIHPVNGFMRGDFTPTRISVTDRTGRPSAAVPTIVTRAAKSRRLHDGTELMKLAVDEPGAKVIVEASIAFEIAFGDGWIRGSVVGEIYVWVRRFVESFAEAFGG